MQISWNKKTITQIQSLFFEVCLSVRLSSLLVLFLCLFHFFNLSLRSQPYMGKDNIYHIFHTAHVHFYWKILLKIPAWWVYTMKQAELEKVLQLCERRKEEGEKTPSFYKMLNKWVRLSWTRQYFTPGLFVKSLSQIFSLQALWQSRKVHIIDSITITKLVFKIVILVKNYYRRVHYKRFIGFHRPP